MADNDALNYQELVKNSLIEIRKLKAKVAELQQGQTPEPIAVVGMACQFPQGNKTDDTTDIDGLNAYWQVLEHGIDAVIEAPDSRLNREQFFSPDPNAAGKIISTRGGYLHDIDRFAADFFFISPREANSLDPQQRMLLENHWRALEHAGIQPSTLMGRQAGLFVGICGNDYYHLLASRDYAVIDSYMASGTAHSTAAGRLAFYLGTHGPAIAVDTACSSSLVAVHLACQSLREGECELALASGVNALLAPEYSINFSRAGMLSPKGLCKTFDDSADGYVRGEGCGVVVLKRLSDAERDGDNILALVRGSATNQDGRSSGLTAPNGNAQRQVISQALSAARLSADQVSYVEAHGTGTSLGDPIELEALQAVYGKNRQMPLNIGSVKSSIGHLEGAAGIAGFIKTVLMLQQKKIPKQLHFNTPNRHVDWSAMQLKVNRQLTDWNILDNNQRVAGVSSFGFGGTNAHILLSEAEIETSVPPANLSSPQLLTVSASSQQELALVKQALIDYLQVHPDLNLSDLCYRMNSKRDHFPLRMAWPCHSIAEAITLLQQPITEQCSDYGQDRQIAWLFTGQGAFNGAINEITVPEFKRQLARCEAGFKQRTGVDLNESLFTGHGAQRLLNTQYAQPALFCFQYAQAKTWQTLGLEAEYLLGHSVGEYAVACLAGVLSFDDALKLISLRGQLMQTLTEPASMIAVLADADRVKQVLEDIDSQLVIAAYNGQSNTVVSGSYSELMEFQNALDSQDIAYIELKVDRAFHSPLMQTMLSEFAEAAQQIQYHQPIKNIISSKTGGLIGKEIAHAQYWIEQISQPVLFTRAMQALQQQGINLALEIGPQAVLSKMLQREYPRESIQAIASMTDQYELLQAVADIYCAGVDLDWKGLYQDFKGQYLNLPGYPFIRKHYWYEHSVRESQHNNTDGVSTHPLLQQSIEPATSNGQRIFQSRIDAASPGFHQDHRYQDKILIPAAHYLEMVLAAFAHMPCRISRVSYPQPLLLQDDESKTLQLILTADGEGFDCAIYARSETEQSWHCYFKAHVEPLTETPTMTFAGVPLQQTVAIDDFYQAMQRRGIDFDNSYRLLDRLAVFDDRAQGRICPVENIASYLCYPPMLDACFQVSGALLPVDSEATFVQSGFDSFEIYGKLGSEAVLSTATLSADSSDSCLYFDIDIVNEKLEPVGRIKRLGLQKIAQQPATRLFYNTQWQKVCSMPDSPANIQLDDWATHIQFEQSQDKHPELINNLHRQSLNHVIKALLELGWQFQVGQCFSQQQCREQLGILPNYEKLLNRCLYELSEAGFICSDKDQWQCLQPLKPIDPVQNFDSTIEMQLLNQCGMNLAGVLNGKTDCLPLLFPDNNPISASALYSQAEGFIALNQQAASVVKAWQQTYSQSRKLKILEIGAGTGGTSRVVLPVLTQLSGVEYVYTDLSSGFFNQAKNDFASYSFIQYRTLDISKDPAHQGFVDNDFDLIIAANAIHATADLSQTLKHIHQLLKPDASLILLEGLQPQLWVDLIFGLTEGWWAFTDHRLSQGYPLLDEEGWQQSLAQAGFKQTRLIIPELSVTERLCRQSIILSQTVKKQTPCDWLIVTDQNGIAEQIAVHLTDKGDQCTLIDLQSGDHQTPNRFNVDPMQGDDFDRVIEQWLKQSNASEKSVINACGLDAVLDNASQLQDIQPILNRVCGGSLHLMQALGRSNLELKQMLCLTRGSQQLKATEPGQPLMHTFWGMMRVAMREYPQFNARLLDLDTETEIDPALMRVLTLPDSTTDPQTAIRAQQIYAPRLTALELSASQPLNLDSAACYLVTGAFGGMGFKLTQWLIEQGAKKLILLARSRPTENNQHWLQQMQDNGIEIEVVSVDISDYQSLKTLLANKQALAGIFHCAGIFADSLLQDYDWSGFSKVFPSKVQGCWNLHQLSLELKLNLDYFVLFSSSASLLAVSGLANYVAANSFIDALAHFRKQQNLPALSINWGVWAETGMASAVNDTRRQQWQTMGVNPMQTEFALQSMQTVMGSTESNVAIVDIDFNQFVSNQNYPEQQAYFERVISEHPNQQASDKNNPDSVLLLLKKHPEQQGERLQEYISQTVASVLGIANDLDPRRGFFELGMDSLTSMELRNRLQREFECNLDATLTFKYPSVHALTDYLLELITQQSSISENVQSQHLVDDEIVNQSTDNLTLAEQLDDIDRFLAEDDV